LVQGQTILEHLEALEPADVYEEDKLVFRANCDSTKTEYHDFRGYAGKLYGNNIKVGDAVTVLPSLTESKLNSLLINNLMKLQ
jgi:sulfate adenylyltransferase subunit 1